VGRVPPVVARLLLPLRDGEHRKEGLQPRKKAGAEAAVNEARARARVGHVAVYQPLSVHCAAEWLIGQTRRGRGHCVKAVLLLQRSNHEVVAASRRSVDGRQPPTGASEPVGAALEEQVDDADMSMPRGNEERRLAIPVAKQTLSLADRHAATCGMQLMRDLVAYGARRGPSHRRRPIGGGTAGVLGVITRVGDGRSGVARRGYSE
jgi:hypothetical protein